MRGWFCSVLCCSILCPLCCALLGAAESLQSDAVDLPPALNLEVFEDAECVRDPGGTVLLDLLNDFAVVLDGILVFQSEDAWIQYRAWKAEHESLMFQLTASLLSRPYCEPAKVAATTATCALMLDEGELSEEDKHELLLCTLNVEAMLRDTLPAEPTPRTIYSSRIHLFLRSLWPGFRLLDALVRLSPVVLPGPDRDSLIVCNEGSDDANFHGFDWEWFQRNLLRALDLATVNPQTTALRLEDGPLSEQYRARWTRLYTVPSFQASASFAVEVSLKFGRKPTEAGCVPAIAAAYGMQMVVMSLRDTEAWMQRHASAAWGLLNLGMQLSVMIGMQWPVFRCLHLGSLLRRHNGPNDPRRGPEELSIWSGPYAATHLQDHLRGILASQPSKRTAYLTSVWGKFADYLVSYIARWIALQMPLLIILAMDASSAVACQEAAEASGKPELVYCVAAPESRGLEALVTKYIALAVVCHCTDFAAWIDMDVYFAQDPTLKLKETLESASGSPQLAFATCINSRSVMPSILAAKGGDASSEVLLQYASWLSESPYIQDHQGWDTFLQNSDGDFGAGWDYKGRNISSAPNDGLEMSFAPPIGARGPAVNYVRLGPEFASADGWIGDDIGDLVAFHFWGAREGQLDLFASFYPCETLGFNPVAKALVSSYHRSPSAPRVMSGELSAPTHITAISYADGCCYKAIERNRESALSVGVDAAISYNRTALDPAWIERNSEVLSQKKGAGWWLWKPYVILKTLRDDSVPWNTGVVLWLDAGNHFVESPRQLVDSALATSDVAAMRLKCCLETDWTSALALKKLDALHYTVADRPQLGAYFLLFRKTVTTLKFVEDWLRLSEDPELIVESYDAAAPAYQRHMADQSIFSILFKERGFQAFPLQEGHQVVKLERWRE